MKGYGYLVKLCLQTNLLRRALAVLNKLILDLKNLCIKGYDYLANGGLGLASSGLTPIVQSRSQSHKCFFLSNNSKFVQGLVVF